MLSLLSKCSLCNLIDSLVHVQYNEHLRVNWTCTSESIKLHNEHFESKLSMYSESIKLHNEHFKSKLNLYEW
jgi:hypothetical protein